MQNNGKSPAEICANDSAMKMGQTIHKALELEVQDEILIETTTEEDRWGLKIVNMLSGYQSLLATGLTREMPVFGFVGDVLVRGVIDELRYEQVQPSKTIHSNQMPITDFIEHRADYQTKLIDAKSRVRRTVPSESQQQMSKLQLMLYRSLLQSLVKDGIDIARLAEISDFGLETPFSDTFIKRLQSADDHFYDLVSENSNFLLLWKHVANQLRQLDGSICKTLTVVGLRANKR